MIKMDPFNQFMMNHNNTTNMDDKKTLLFARALYDNTADMPRELSFKKGDILNVLENNYDESFGEWWVCSLKNKVGLAPSNRLEPLPLLVNNPKSPTTNNRLSDQIYANDINSSNTLSNQSYYCELPTTNNKLEQPDPTYFNFTGQPEHTYLNSDVVDLVNQQKLSDVYCDTYQVPEIDQPQVSDTSEYSQLPIDSTYQQLPTHNLYSNGADTDYMTTTAADIYNNISNYDNDYNNFSEIAQENNSSETRPGITDKMSHLDVINLKSQTPDVALVYFQELQTNLVNTCNRIIEFVKSKWTELDSLTVNLPDIRLAFLQVKKDIQIICEYLTQVILPLLLTEDQGAIMDSITDLSFKSTDPELYKRISKLTSQLNDCHTSINSSLTKLDSMDWYAPSIATYLRMVTNPSESPLNNVVNIARNVLIFLRSLSICVKANISLIFPSKPPSLSRDSTPTNPEVDLTSIHTEIKLQLNTTQQNIKTFSELLMTRNSSNPSPSNLINQSKSILRNSTQLVCLIKNHESMLKLDMSGLIKRFCELINQLVGSIKMYTTRPVASGMLTHVQIATHELSNHIEEMKKQVVTM